MRNVKVLAGAGLAGLALFFGIRAAMAKPGEVDEGQGELVVTILKPPDMPQPIVYVNGTNYGRGGVLLPLTPGQYTVSFEDRPGGDNPKIGVDYYKGPQPVTVTVERGKTVEVKATFEAVPTVQADVQLLNASIEGFSPGVINVLDTSKQYNLVISLRNPTGANMLYTIYVCAGEPDEAETALFSGGRPVIGALDIVTVIGDYATRIPIKPVQGSYSLWLRIYDARRGSQLVWLKQINTGLSVSAAPAGQGAGLPLTIGAQLSNIINTTLIDRIWLLQNGIWYMWDRATPAINTITNSMAIQVGNQLNIHVTAPAAITVGPITYYSKANGWIDVPAF